MSLRTQVIHCSAGTARFIFSCRAALRKAAAHVLSRPPAIHLDIKFQATPAVSPAVLVYNRAFLMRCSRRTHSSARVLGRMQFGSTLGAKLVSCSLVGVLYGMVCAQCYSFYQRSNRGTSNRVISFSVFLLWLLSSTHFIFSEMDTYLSLVGVVNRGEINNVAHWQTAAVDIVTLVTTLFVQCWYCHRMWILSRKNALLVHTLLVIIVLWFGTDM